MDNFIKGTCESMCPDEEIKLRTREKLLHFFERDHGSHNYVADKNKTVKEFARSAAGMRAPRKEDLRTTAALIRTVEYLLEEILPDERKPFNVVYDFIFDRLRAVRQEIVIQNLGTTETIRLLEPIILFLAYSAYRLSDEPFDRYDPKICHQHLQECLKKILTCYDETDLLSPRGPHTAPYNLINRQSIEALYLLFNIGHSDALKRMLRVPVEVKNDLYVAAAQISISFNNDNFYRCAEGIKKLPHIMAAIASLKMQTIRREILLRFSAAYQSKVLTVPFDWLQTILSCSEADGVANLCKYYNISYDAGKKCVKFSRADFNVHAPIMKSDHEHFVDEKLKYLRIRDVLTLKNLCLH